MFVSFERKVENMKRHKMSKSHSKKLFRHTGARTHKKNMPSRVPMRGGIRL